MTLPSARTMPEDATVVPSATTIKLRFPAFRTFDDASIEFAVEEAVVACGQTAAQNNSDWIDNFNLTLAIQYYAAHLLQIAVMRGGTGTIKSSERTPEFSVTYATPPYPKPDEAVDFTMTIYGTRFLGLVKKNFPAVLGVNSAVRF